MIGDSSGSTEAMYKYEVCISFAGEDRDVAEQMAAGLRECGISVFFDTYYQADLVGRDLSAHLSEIYANEAQFCLLLVSAAYSSKKWTMNIELPAVRERVLEDGDKYIIPVLTDDTRLPEILRTLGHVDVRKLGFDAAIALVCKKVLMKRYDDCNRYVPESWRKEGFLRVAEGVNSAEVLDMFCHFIFNASTAEIRISTFTPLRFFQSAQFRLTLQMLSDKLEAETRNGTLRIYCLPKEEERLRLFTTFSREPIDIPFSKLKRARDIALSVLEYPSIKKCLRIQILHHDGIASFHTCQVGKHMFFTTYRLGQKQDAWTLYYFDRDTAPPSFADGFDNFFIDLDMRSSFDTLNWF